MIPVWPPPEGTPPTYQDKEVNGTFNVSGPFTSQSSITTETNITSDTSTANVYGLTDSAAVVTGTTGMYLNGTTLTVNTPSQVLFQDSATSSGTCAVNVLNSTFEATQFLTTSDQRVKTDIRSLAYEDAVDVLSKLRPVTFKYTSNPDKKRFGFIAQEVQTKYPEMVNENSEGMLAIDQQQLISVLVRVLQGP